MKTLVTLLAAAGILAGCVAYPVPYDDNRPRQDHRDHRDGDRDHDGIPNRVDRDRDGDGVRNRQDSNPNNPYRY